MNHNQAQDPYGSFIVRASAGCGKTYQLSRRFLHLIGAGAAPGDILAITFTKKAAGEMRQRIVSDAARLLREPDASREFDRQMQIFYHAYRCKSRHPVAPPVSAVACARKVLAGTQQLRITTIDATFWEWVRKFPWEASGMAQGEGPALPAVFDLVNELESQELNDTAFNNLVLSVFAKELSIPNRLLNSFGLYGLKNRFDQLKSFTTYLWLERLKREGKAPLCQFAIGDRMDASSLLDQLGPVISEILPALNLGLAKVLRDAIEKQDLDAILTSGFITKTNLTVSGRYLRGKKREQFSDAIRTINHLIQRYTNYQRIGSLHECGLFLLELFHGYHMVRDELKFAKGQVEFHDLAKGCYRLFHDQEALGARFLIHQSTRHLLLDEFQDTSRLQWSIFEPLAVEMLSGEGVTRAEEVISPTVFIVGDPKQSIYGFREADPTLIDKAAMDLRPFGLHSVDLNQSYRSAPQLMHMINLTFSTLMPDFPQHSTAGEDSAPIVPGHGWVTSAFAFSQDHDGKSPAEQEAAYVADKLAQILHDADQHPVYDKQLAGFRPISANDCVVLFRNSTRAKIFESALRERGIACLREQAEGFFQRQEISDVSAIIRWFAVPCDTRAFCQILASPLGPSINLASAIENADTNQNTTAAKGLLPWLSELDASQTPSQLLLQLYHKRGVPEIYREVFPEGEGELAAANLIQFLELVHELETDGCHSMLALDLRLQQMAKLGSRGNAAVSSNAVTLMTIHKAKGLEFPLVALVDSGDKWEKRDLFWVKDPNKSGIFYMGTKEEQPVNDSSFEQVIHALDSQLQAESLRLLYVALTRARQFLLVTGHRSPKNRQSRGFLDHLQDCQRRWLANETDREIINDFRQPVQVTRPESAMISYPTLGKTPGPKIQQVFSVRPFSLIEDQRSQSNVEDKEIARVYGILVHHGLEQHFAGELADYEMAWESSQTLRSIQPSLIEQAQVEVKLVLASVALNQVTSHAIAIHAEFPFCQLGDGHQLIRGRIDLVVEKPDGIWVVDFKTKSEDQNPQLYQDQITTYCQAVEKIFQNQRSVFGYVFFTNNQSLKLVRRPEPGAALPQLTSSSGATKS